MCYQSLILASSCLEVVEVVEVEVVVWRLTGGRDWRHTDWLNTDTGQAGGSMRL